jgi:hypothetical protein
MSNTSSHAQWRRGRERKMHDIGGNSAKMSNRQQERKIWCRSGARSKQTAHQHSYQMQHVFFSWLHQEMIANPDQRRVDLIIVSWSYYSLAVSWVQDMRCFVCGSTFYICKSISVLPWVLNEIMLACWDMWAIKEFGPQK